MNRKLIIIIIISLSFLFLSTDINVIAADDPLIACRGDTLTITARLLQNGTFGNPVPDQELEFFDQTMDKYLESSITDSDGFASIDWNIPLSHSLGQTILNVTFRGNDSLFLTPSCQYLIITILSRTELVFDVEDDNLAPGDMLKVIATLYDDADLPLTDKNISLVCEGLVLSKLVTNSTGCVTFSIECNRTWCDLGTNTLHLIYDLDMATYTQGVTEAFTIEINPIQTHLSISNIPEEWNLNDTVLLEPEFWTERGFLDDVELELRLDGSLLSTIALNESGTTTYPLEVDDRFTIGTHLLSISFSGTERFALSSVEIDVSIYSAVFIDIMTEEIIVIGEESTIIVGVADAFQRPIPNATLTLRDLSTNSTYTKPTSETTLVHFTLIPNGLRGLRTLLVNVTDMEYIINGTLIWEVAVWTRPTLLISKDNTLGYASPSQEIELHVLLSRESTTYSNCQITLLAENGSLVTQSYTDSQGIAILSWKVPSAEGLQNYSIRYNGDINDYILHRRLVYVQTISAVMPLSLQLDYYVICTPLQEIQVYLTLYALNGTPLQDIVVDFEWQYFTTALRSQNQGRLAVHLPVPSSAGSYILGYSIASTGTTLALVGTIQIIVDADAVLTSQGIGISGMIASVFLSGGLAAVPIIRRWYLVG